MGMLYEDLEELCQTVGDKISEANDKIGMANGDLSGGDVEFLDKLTHMLKSIKTTKAMMEAEEGYSHDGRMSDGYSGHYGNMGGGRYYPGYSYARGRGSNARRDSMGRYSRGYSRGDDDMVEQVRELMEKAPEDQTRRDFQKILDRMDT